MRRALYQIAETGEADTVQGYAVDAQILSGHSAVIWLENVTGCYLLDRVRAA